MLKVKGLVTIQPIKVDLSRYFGGASVSVTIRPLTVPARARIQELTTEGMRYATTQTKKALNIDAIEQAMPAVTILAIREEKLKDAVVSHDLKGEDGESLAWGKELWDTLDAANPDILGHVIDRITELSYPEDEEGEDDPTSPAKSGKR